MKTPDGHEETVTGRLHNGHSDGACANLLFHGIVATHADLISFRVPEVRAVIVGMIVRSQTGRAFARAGIRQRASVCVID